MDLKASLRLSQHCTRARNVTFGHNSFSTISAAARRVQTARSLTSQPLGANQIHSWALRRTTSPQSAMPSLSSFARFNSTSTPLHPPSSQPSETTTTHPSNPSQKTATAAEEQENAERDVPAYELTFTCKPCRTRSTHRISKHGYHKGSVLITCPQCKNRHVISDHLRIFNDTSKSLEQILKEKGELLKTGVLDPDLDIELWEDGSVTDRGREETGVKAEGASEAKPGTS